MEERCELCEKKAMVHCDSDQAKLCWGCDATVHSANFLVAKHMRVLLCRICNSHTQWNACGPKLIPSASFCHRCMANGGTRLHHQVVDDDDDDDGRYNSDDSESDSDDDDDNNVEEDDDKENQVVPLYSPSPLDSALKRELHNSSSIHSNSPTSTSSEMLSAVAALPRGEDSSFVSSSFRPLKKRRINQ